MLISIISSNLSSAKIWGEFLFSWRSGNIAVFLEAFPSHEWNFNYDSLFSVNFNDNDPHLMRQL